MIERAKSVIKEADALLITAGAGMGVDSGLPDFRGTQGFWKAYPIAKKLGLRFEEMANPRWFDEDPSLAWAFYGHRLHLYRDTTPHEGFSMLLSVAKSKKDGYFVFTSNVDGQFQKAGFDENKIVECHGSIHYLQCTKNCSGKIWSAKGVNINIDENFKAKEPLPRCLDCGLLARPNILMFGDWYWESSRSDAQTLRFSSWIETLKHKRSSVAIIEIGAGTAVDTVRRTSQEIAKYLNAPLIRINPREPQGADIPIAMGALEALKKIL